MFFNIIETIQKEHFASIKKMYPNVNYVISENYGFDIGSFFHILEIVKQRKESYDYLIKLHTKTGGRLLEQGVHMFSCQGPDRMRISVKV